MGVSSEREGHDRPRPDRHRRRPRRDAADRDPDAERGRPARAAPRQRRGEPRGHPAEGRLLRRTPARRRVDRRTERRVGRARSRGRGDTRSAVRSFRVRPPPGSARPRRGRNMTSSQVNRSTSQPWTTQPVVAARVAGQRRAIAVPLERVGLEHDAEPLVDEVGATQEPTPRPDRDLRLDPQTRDVEGDRAQRGLEGVGRPAVGARGDATRLDRARSAQSRASASSRPRPNPSRSAESATARPSDPRIRARRQSTSVRSREVVSPSTSSGPRSVRCSWTPARCCARGRTPLGHGDVRQHGHHRNLPAVVHGGAGMGDDTAQPVGSDDGLVRRRECVATTRHGDDHSPSRGRRSTSPATWPPPAHDGWRRHPCAPGSRPRPRTRNQPVAMAATRKRFSTGQARSRGDEQVLPLHRAVAEVVASRERRPAPRRARRPARAGRRCCGTPRWSGRSTP